MKNANKLNLAVVGLPIILALFGIVETSFLFFALISTILTGFVQVIIGLAMLIDEPMNKKLQVYIFSVIIFFFLWFGISNSKIISDKIYYLLFVIPILLAMFLSYIIYKKSIEK
jgi:hypothetical protein